MIFASIARAGAAEYVVAGIKLGDRVSFNSADYRSYSCQPNAIADLTRCQRSRQRTGQRGILTVVETLVHTPDGTAVHLVTSVTPASLNKPTIDQEVADLSNAFGERATIMEEHYLVRPLATSVIALWGSVKLEGLDWEMVDKIKSGNAPPLGALVDHIGDVRRSAQERLPIYRVTGGKGFVYSASFDRTGFGHRRYIAVDATHLAIKTYEAAMRNILRQDSSRPSDDYRLWPEVARATRRLARDASIDAANAALTRAYAAFQSKKFQSRVWAILPGGVIEHLASGVYATVDVYPPNSKYRDIRRSIDAFLSANPAAPFAEFLYYAIGEFEKGLQVAPRSVISDVLHYAIGHRNVERLLREAFVLLVPKEIRDEMVGADPMGVSFLLSTFNSDSRLQDFRQLKARLPSFPGYAAAAKPHFAAVLQNPSSPHADDAAYMLGWLALHEGNSREALAYFGQAMRLGNKDYDFPALRQALRILRPLTTAEQVAALQLDAGLSQKPALWYLASRAHYRNYDYQQTIDTGESALKTLNVPPERLPASTEPGRIAAALDRIRPELRGDRNLLELVYIVQASRELLQFKAYLSRLAAERAADVNQRLKATITKYSMLLDDEEQRLRKLDTAAPVHRDLRQASHLIDATMSVLPKSSQYGRLREWLHYRRISVLAAYDAPKVARAVADMEQDVPRSQLLDDALAEQVRAEGFVLRDLDAARRTFKKLTENYPTGNAIDNAHTWMAIILRCEGRVAEAQAMNQYIMRRFPLTRHAQYARERMTDPRREKMGDRCGDR